MKKIFCFIICLLCLVPIAAAYTIEQWPFKCDFEDNTLNQEWRYTLGNKNFWKIGKLPEDSTNTVLFLTSDSVHAVYTPLNAGNHVYESRAYISFGMLPAGTYILDFDYKVGGHLGTHYMYNKIYDGNNGNNYKYSSSMYGRPDWTHQQLTYHADNGFGNCIIGFEFRVTGNDTVATNFSAAVDNVRFYRVETDSTMICAEIPQLLSHQRSGNNAIFTWSAHAAEYEVEYYPLGDAIQKHYVVTNVTAPTFSIDCSTVPEGAYHFQVRSICGRDTSEWTILRPVLLYDNEKHCMDYLDFTNPDIQAQYGSFSYPTSKTGSQDKGYYSPDSRHTVHFVPNDYDERTGYKLRTYPKGHPAAVRLGNWLTNSEAEAITYTMTITQDMKILKLWYALVMQLPGHAANEQPRFQMEILDQNNQYLDSHCGVVDFTASANLEGWNTEPSHKHGDTTSVIWKDWSLIGINLRDYVGQTIKIRLTVKDCNQGAHFGYAYFAMECSPGEIEGIYCGVKPDHFTVDEGFYYRWYRKYDNPQVILGRDRTFTLEPTDTATYCVDMIQLLDTTCYYTMEASSLAYIPHADAISKWVPENCHNYVQMEDYSTTQGVYWTEEHEKRVVVERAAAGDSYFWDFGPYGTSTERNPKLVMADAGGPLHIVLYVQMEDGRCIDTLAWDMQVPAIGLQQIFETHYICPGGSVTVNGTTYTEVGYYDSDTIHSNVTGCDSISTLSIQYFPNDTMSHRDTICPSQFPLAWNGLNLMEPGIYYHQVTNSQGCDSVVDELILTIRDSLIVQVDQFQKNICHETKLLEFPFEITAGDVTSYSLYFDSELHPYGFNDMVDIPVYTTEIPVELGTIPWPGEVTGHVVLFNHDCDNVSIPLSIEVHYTADSVITQRWNDLLSVRKTAFDLYGGFHDYQWYKNGSPLSGETRSQLYLPTEGVDMDATYSVEFTRDADGVRLRSCEFVPTMQPATSTMAVYPTLLSPAAPLHVVSGEAGAATIYNRTGAQVATWQLIEGENVLTAPAQLGLYILRVTDADGQNKVVKLIVE